MFLSRLAPDGECLTWVGALTSEGYGQITVEGQLMRSHRFAYELVNGPIPTGMHIDHICRNRACVNPDHLEAVSVRDNVLRGVGASAVNARKTHCMRGHEFTPENTYRPPKHPGTRSCRECQRAANARHTDRRAAHSGVSGAT